MSKDEDAIYFSYIDEEGEKQAEVLTLFNINGYDKDYALCSVPMKNKSYNIMAFIVNESIPGTVQFDDIEDPEEFAQVSDAVKKLLESNH